MEFESQCGGVVCFLNVGLGFLGFVLIVAEIAFGFSVEGEGGDVDERVGTHGRDVEA